MKHLFLPLLLVLASPASLGRDFTACLDRLQLAAQGAGLSEHTTQNIVPSLQEQVRAVQLDRKQPEFLQSFAEYLAQRVNGQRIARGRELLDKHRDFLLELQHQYGVPPHYLLAFWGLETNYGGYLGRMPTLDSLATLACDPRRSKFFTAEFIAALQLMEREALQPDTMRGSWAGAVGHTQFMPSSYLRYAVDGDGDQRSDLWRSERDALASAANYLQQLGWQSGLRWGREVRVAEGEFPWQLAGRKQSQSLKEWSRHGLQRADGNELPALDLAGSLILPAGHQGPAFLVYDNFKVIMKWNRSELYAIAVGHLADRIAGGGGLLASSEGVQPLRREDVATAQRQLNALGYEAGPVDGVLGSGTRAALRSFQQDQALVADGYPDETSLEAIAKHAES